MFGAILYHTVLFCRKTAKNCVTAPPTTTDNRVRAVPSGPGLPGIESGGGCRPPNRWFQGFVLSRFRSILVVLCHHRSIWLDEAIHIYKYINPVNRYPAANLGNWAWGDLSACQGLPAAHLLLNKHPRHLDCQLLGFLSVAFLAKLTSFPSYHRIYPRPRLMLLYHSWL